MRSIKAVIGEGFEVADSWVDLCDETWRTVFHLVYGSSLAVHALSRDRILSSRFVMDLFDICNGIDLCIRKSLETRELPGGLDELNQRILDLSPTTESLGKSLPSFGVVILMNIMIRFPFMWLQFLMGLTEVVRHVEQEGQGDLISEILDAHRHNVAELERHIRISVLTERSGALDLAEKWGKEVSAWLESSPNRLVMAILNPNDFLMEVNSVFGAPWIRDEADGKQT